MNNEGFKLDCAIRRILNLQGSIDQAGKLFYKILSQYFFVVCFISNTFQSVFMYCINIIKVHKYVH